MVGYGPTCDKFLPQGMQNGDTIINKDCVANIFYRVDNKTGSSSFKVEVKFGLIGYKESLDPEILEHEGSHLQSIGLWVSWGLGKHDIVLRWVNFELIGEAEVPNLPHSTPIGNDT